MDAWIQMATVLAQEGNSNTVARILEALFNPRNFPILMVFSVPIVAVIATFWHLSIRVRSNNDLKRSMLDRGMSSQEIEQVMNAGEKSTKKR